MQVILENVRSFAGKHKIPIRPLTLLVGENSSGKTTFLAAVSCVFNSQRFPGNPGFNEPPYNLGTFDTIATFKAGKYGRANNFSMGFRTDESNLINACEVVGTYRNEFGNLVCKRVEIRSDNDQLKLALSDSEISGKVKLDGEPERAINKKAQTPFLRFAGMSNLYNLLMMVGESQPEVDKLILSPLSAMEAGGFESSFSFAPVRSKPKRTYDEFSESYSPEGDHIPTLLARLLAAENGQGEGKKVAEALTRFGKDSNLFKHVSVRRLGKKVSDPIQIQVGIAGPSANLVDVGYGVSQALPIVVQSVLVSSSKLTLLQQPEVHLHPRAQAALGTFFVDLVRDNDRFMLVETHSDYLVDRVRQEVAAGKLDPDKVVILFFQKPHLETTVHPLYLDASGNVENAPDDYRQFFMEEEIRLLKRTSR